MSCLREEKKKKKKQREKSAVDFNATITRSSFQVHIGGEVNEISERGREGEINRFHFSNFSTLYKDAAGVGSRRRILGKY